MGLAPELNAAAPARNVQFGDGRGASVVDQHSQVTARRFSIGVDNEYVDSVERIPEAPRPDGTRHLISLTLNTTADSELFQRLVEATRQLSASLS